MNRLPSPPIDPSIAEALRLRPTLPDILTSAMHMAWMRTVGGRPKSDYSYSPSIYNSFPWPNVTPTRQIEIERLAQAVLDVRSSFVKTNLDDLYDADGMPPALRRAHLALDKAVDRLYRRAAFAFERDSVEHLFELYEKVRFHLRRHRR
jgi:hypothetical protein